MSRLALRKRRRDLRGLRLRLRLELELCLRLWRPRRWDPPLLRLELGLRLDRRLRLPLERRLRLRLRRRLRLELRLELREDR